LNQSWRSGDFEKNFFFEEGLFVENKMPVKEPPKKKRGVSTPANPQQVSQVPQPQYQQQQQQQHLQQQPTQLHHPQQQPTQLQQTQPQIQALPQRTMQQQRSNPSISQSGSPYTLQTPMQVDVKQEPIQVQDQQGNVSKIPGVMNQSNLQNTSKVLDG